MQNIVFKPVSIDSDDACQMLEELNNTLIGIIGHSGQKYLHLEDFRHEGSVFMIGYVGVEPVCCAGIRRDAPGVGEVKRVYARKNSTGNAHFLMQALENWARENGYIRLILECRENNPHAIAFYHKEGYTDCEKYPPFCDESDAVCMDKFL